MAVDYLKVDAIAAAVADIYADAENALLALLTRRLAAGGFDDDTGTWAARKLGEVRALRRAAQLLVDELERDGNVTVRRAVADGWRAGNTAALTDLAEAQVGDIGPAARSADQAGGTAILGRAYTGIDLRADQVEANREQAAELLAGAAAEPLREADIDDPAALTPVEEHGGRPVKRDDTFAVGGSRGGKVRTALALIGADGARGVTTAGSRHSPQVNIVATIAARYGLPCRVHVPSGELTPELRAARPRHPPRAAPPRSHQGRRRRPHRRGRSSSRRR
ncbi:phage minor capsid protein [Actinoplanes rectilineatus]|uniref:phage minor capsid protein n=1 Tax=Actinoplanes rectilineatus TaxID=113571 RepID=UPI000695B99D|nr:phage minor capsid protein [Actinoplanes rectilineatus]